LTNDVLLMPIDTRPPAIALMGPTASGKTALALAWAERWGGEIISVDSALVYRRLDIGSAKPDAAERARVVHHLLDLREPHEAYSAAEFARDARVAMADIVARGRVPILVGGTGLYFRALFDGLSDMPEIAAHWREAVMADAERLGWGALFDELQRCDPAAAQRIGPSDPQRIGRALEVLRATGRPISDWQRAPRTLPRLPVRVLRLALWPARESLRARIEARLDGMLRAGFLDEVRELMQDARLHADLPALRAVGYRQAWEHLSGATDAAEFRRRMGFATHQLAKRQRTWLRGEHAVLMIDPARDERRIEQLLDDHGVAARA